MNAAVFHYGQYQFVEVRCRWIGPGVATPCATGLQLTWALSLPLNARSAELFEAIVGCDGWGRAAEGFVGAGSLAVIVRD